MQQGTATQGFVPTKINNYIDAEKKWFCSMKCDSKV